MSTKIQTNRSRHGFSLIEMTVVIAVSSVLMGIVITYIIALKQWDRNVRNTNLRGMQTLSLAETLRSDIRGGSDVLLSVEGPLVIMSKAGVQMRYELQDNGCLRTVVTPDNAAGRRDSFGIGREGRWKVERKDSGRRPLIEVTLEPAEKDSTDKKEWSPPLLVYAALGADQSTTAEPVSHSAE